MRHARRTSLSKQVTGAVTVAALSFIDVAAARALLVDLKQAQPQRPEAAEMLRGLGLEP